MALAVTQFDYYYTVTDDETARAAALVSELSRSGINLLAFSAFPCDPGQTQLDLVADDPAALVRAAAGMNLKLSDKKSGFLIRGEQTPDALPGILNRLAQAHIPVTAMQAIAAKDNNFAALLWVKAGYFESAAELLADNSGAVDEVEEASEESFPASDPPAWAGQESA